MDALTTFRRRCLWLPLAGLIIAGASSAHAESASCPRLLQEIDQLAAFAHTTADAYWKHRRSYVDVKIREKHETPKAKQIESDAQRLQKGMQPNWEKIKAALSEAQTLNCKPASELSAIREAVFAKTKSVNFDRFPEDE